ncbi:hypothetical protein H6G33_24535 [Calothrix sp. FACHB-1219]|nr:MULTISPECIES: hypothetical protein [unclassified Calothrix]MBD2205513.1 hypothetical protein [Calothrix sp. FACHB-168]MBD2220176.1 hypothetical protein [Calothrix sp. FACHB-1219]
MFPGVPSSSWLFTKVGLVATKSLGGQQLFGSINSTAGYWVLFALD